MADYMTRRQQQIDKMSKPTTRKTPTTKAAGTKGPKVVSGKAGVAAKQPSAQKLFNQMLIAEHKKRLATQTAAAAAAAAKIAPPAQTDWGLGEGVMDNASGGDSIWEYWGKKFQSLFH